MMMHAGQKHVMHVGKKHVMNVGLKYVMHLGLKHVMHVGLKHMMHAIQVQVIIATMEVLIPIIVSKPPTTTTIPIIHRNQIKAATLILQKPKVAKLTDWANK
jgi:hypothetical protein